MRKLKNEELDRKSVAEFKAAKKITALFNFRQYKELK